MYIYTHMIIYAGIIIFDYVYLSIFSLPLCPSLFLSLSLYIYIYMGWQTNRHAGTLSLGGMVGLAHPPGMGMGCRSGCSAYQAESFAGAWPSGVCVGLWCRSFVLFRCLAAEIPAASWGDPPKGLLGLRPRVSRCGVAHVKLPASTSES